MSLGLQCHKKLPEKLRPLPDMHVHTYCACKQQISDRLILLQMTMNKTYINMHIKSQDLTETYAAKQSCRACEKKSME